MLFDKIKAERIQAMKDKEVVKKDLLGTLIGDASKEDKNPDDAKVIATIKKFIKNLEETYTAIVERESDNLNGLAKVSLEVDILKAYLPKQLTEDGTRVAVKAAIALGSNNMGAVMKYMKENYEGRYDGSLASKIAKELL